MYSKVSSMLEDNKAEALQSRVVIFVVRFSKNTDYLLVRLQFMFGPVSRLVLDNRGNNVVMDVAELEGAKPPVVNAGADGGDLVAWLQLEGVPFAFGVEVSKYFRLISV